MILEKKGVLIFNCILWYFWLDKVYSFEKWWWCIEKFGNLLYEVYGNLIELWMLKFKKKIKKLLIWFKFLDIFGFFY